MKKLIIIPLLIISLFTFGQETKTYDYLSVSQLNHLVIIIINDSEFREEKFDVKFQGYGDFRPAFHWLRKYEEEGWTLYKIDIAVQSQSLSAILRKERE